MNIQINSDHNIEMHENLTLEIRETIYAMLNQVSDQITRVEVYLHDNNNGKHNNQPNNNNISCVMEVRLEGHQPVTVTQHSTTVDQAIDGAVEKLSRLLENILGRLQHKKKKRTDPPFLR